MAGCGCGRNKPTKKSKIRKKIDKKEISEIKKMLKKRKKRRG